MAFATANVTLHSAGSLWNLTGDWTGLVGDTTTGSIGVGGANVVAATIYDTAQSGGGQTPMPYTLSTDTTTSVTTVSWNYDKTVTAGTFSILYI